MDTRLTPKDPERKTIDAERPLIGKIEKLLSERKQQLGESFTIKRFMDEFNAAGLIPASLIRWELTGRQPDDLKRMLN
jgi:Bacterial protein of unknown function (DUF885).